MARRRKARLAVGALLLLIGAALIVAAAGILTTPDDARANESRAARAIASGDVDLAIESLNRAIDSSKGDGEAARHHLFDLLMQRGDCNLKFRRPKAALGDFLRAKLLLPLELVAWERTGSALLALKQFDETALHFDEAALNFPESEQYFRFASGCAHWSRSQELLGAARDVLAQRILPGDDEALGRALDRFTSTAVHPPTRDEIEERYLLPPHGTAARDDAFERLAEARAEFAAAEEKLADFDLCAELDPAFGRVRVAMHLRAGRWYEGRRLCEILLKLVPPDDLSDEVLDLKLSLATIGRELALPTDSAQAFQQLRRAHVTLAQAAQARGDEGGSKVELDLSRRFQLAAIEERLKARQGQEALKLVEQLGTPNATSLLQFFYLGFARYLCGDRNAALAPLETTVKLLVEREGNSAQFRDTAHRGWVFDGLIEALSTCGRVEIAIKMSAYALRGAPDPAAVLERKIQLERPLRELAEDLVADEFALLALRREGSETLTRFERDWLGLKGNSPKRVIEQATRVTRVYAQRMVTDPALAKLVDAGRRDRNNTRPSAAALETAGSALLKDLEGDPGLALAVARALVRGGQRDQAYLLLFGLVQAYPKVADFRLLLARHDAAEGDLDDAARELDVLLETNAGDFDVANFAYEVARDRGDRKAVREIEERVMQADAAATGSLLGARIAFDDGFAAITLAATAFGDPATPTGRRRLGLAARAKLALGDAKGAEETARKVLAAAPDEPSALTALIALLATRGECDAWLDANSATLESLSPSEIAELGRTALVGGATSASERFARAALDRQPNQRDATLLLADTLLLLGRGDEVEPLLIEPPGTARSIAEERRRVLVLLTRDGPDAAYVELKNRVLAGDAERPLARWTTLLAAASGRLQAAFDLMRRQSLRLSEDESRCLALAALLHKSPIDDNSIPAAIAAQIRSVGAKQGARERELDRWLSFALAEPEGRFLATMARRLLLDGEPGLEPLAQSEEHRLFALYPSLGTLARARAAELDDAGRSKEAAALLAAQVQADPHDVESYHQLAMFVNELDRATLDKVTDLALGSELDLPFQAIFGGWRDVIASDGKRGLRLLLKAAETPSARPVALYVLARGRARRAKAPQIAALPRSPWCDVAEAVRSSGRNEDVEATLLDAARSAEGDVLLLRRLARRLGDSADPLDPELARALCATLIAIPGPWFEAWSRALDELLAVGANDTSSEHVAQLDSLAQSLEAAVATQPNGLLPASAVDALRRFATAADGAGLADRAKRAIELARRACPDDPSVLALAGSIAARSGDTTSASSLFERARLFGDRDPENALWLARNAFETRGQPSVAKKHCDEALAAAKGPGNTELRARIQETLARVQYVIGNYEGARQGWLAAAKERGEPPQHSLAIGLEAFARAPAEAAMSRLRALLEVDSPARPLIERLATVSEAEWQAAALKPKGAPANSGPKKPAVPPKK